MFVAAPAVNAPLNFMINTALGSPCPSRVSVPATDPAPPIEYTPGVSVSPLPKAGACVPGCVSKILFKWI